MLSKSEIKYIQSLHNKKERNIEQKFIVETPKLVSELIHSRYIIEKIYTTNENAIESNISTTVVSENELMKISALQTPNQTLAVVEMPTSSIDKIDTTNKLNLILDGIQDPGNFGTIIRTADWFNIKNIICSNDCVDIYNPKVIQATMGSFVRVNVVYTNLFEYLAEENKNIYGAVLNGTDVRQQTKPAEGFLIIGNEGNGIRKNILPLITHAISIEKYGQAESLNAAIATGILLSHLV